MWFVCVNQRDLRETSGVSSVWIDRVLLRVYSPADSAEAADKRQVEEMLQTTITAVLAFLAEIKEIKEISRKRIQSQVYLNYVEYSRNSLSKNSLDFIGHVVSEKLA